jgi:hypothetical protein
MFSLNKNIFLALFAVLLLVGAGCGSTEPIVEETTKPELTQTLVKKPADLPPVEKAYEFCEDQGYNVVVAFDEQSEQHRISCIFEDNTQCDVVSYFESTCGPGKSGKLSLGVASGDSLTNLRYCDTTSPAVCGSDGKNYTNRCAASQLGVQILHEGLCSEAEKANRLVPESPQSAAASSHQTSQSTKQSSSGTPSWLPTVYGIVQAQSPKSPRPIVERCVYTEGTFYHYYDGGFSTLYNTDGSVGCFPKNDITEDCPTFFSISNRKSNCAQIWRDNR